MAKQNAKDLTVGSPTKLILGFLVPLLFGLLFQQVYNLVDTVIVGKYLGVTALAGVGATGSINFLILGFCNGTCSGFSIPVAQQYGAKDFKALKKYVGNAVVLAIIFAGIVTLLTTTLCHQILAWMHTPDDIVSMSYDYIFVIFAGIPFTVLVSLLSGFIRSLGDSKTPLIFLIICSFLNIGMDLLFILKFGMGVKGAGLATIIAQAISGILCLILVVKKFDLLHITKEDLKLSPHFSHTLIRMGFPMGFQFSITAIGSVILQTNLNTLGSIYVAANTAAIRISGILMCPLDALGQTMATYSGQNIGAGKIDRIGKGLKSANIMGWIYSTLALFIAFFLGKYIILAFVDAKETDVIKYAFQLLVTNIAFYYFLVEVGNIRSTIQGIGFSGFSLFSGVSEMIARTLIGAVFIPLFGFNAACFASPFAWVLADIFLVPGYYHCMKKIKARHQ